MSSLAVLCRLNNTRVDGQLYVHAAPLSRERDRNFVMLKTVLSGIRRTIGVAPVRKRAATADIVIAMSPTATSLRALRNRAIILLGFAGAFRRSEARGAQRRRLRGVA